jgi:hypothetical protein
MSRDALLMRRDGYCVRLAEGWLSSPDMIASGVPRTEPNNRSAGMWPFRKKPEPVAAPIEQVQIYLKATDNMHTRVENAMRYAGFANPNRIGTVDAVTFILTEYERLYGPTINKS